MIINMSFVGILVIGVERQAIQLINVRLGHLVLRVKVKVRVKVRQVRSHYPPPLIHQSNLIVDTNRLVSYVTLYSWMS